MRVRAREARVRAIRLRGNLIYVNINSRSLARWQNFVLFDETSFFGGEGGGGRGRVLQV